MTNFNNATTNLPIPDTAGVRAYKAQRLQYHTAWKQRVRSIKLKR